MSNNQAMRTLQHASEYIFSSRINVGSPKTMRNKPELWYAMAILHECRNSIQIESEAEAYSAAYRQTYGRPMLVCALSA